jgi:hypothetical protein
VLRHLSTAAKEVRITGLSDSLTTVECDSCAISKAHRIIRRETRKVAEQPGVHLALDFYDFKESTMNCEKTLLLIINRYSGYMWDFYMTAHTGEEILVTLKWFWEYLKKQYNIAPLRVELDNEIFERRQIVKD